MRERDAELAKKKANGSDKENEEAETSDLLGQEGEEDVIF